MVGLPGYFDESASLLIEKDITILSEILTSLFIL